MAVVCLCSHFWGASVPRLLPGWSLQVRSSSSSVCVVCYFNISFQRVLFWNSSIRTSSFRRALTANINWTGRSASASVLRHLDSSSNERPDISSLQRRIKVAHRRKDIWLLMILKGPMVTDSIEGNKWPQGTNCYRRDTQSIKFLENPVPDTIEGIAGHWRYRKTHSHWSYRRDNWSLII